ncbi:DUF72 domain-containing protein [Marichromatium sp. AB31]|uniref:DUF72 domain-containing protein n=1 Tax=Marichromatium sp. AB31 TaxID=2483362 RepID=UPI000F4001DA|nr:DUF72 domain-containing protein [Marichromatium sp. AB31]RNE90543.1 DUF72 domain-containing protein [Marichromatium sp. AB31]
MTEQLDLFGAPTAAETVAPAPRSQPEQSLPAGLRLGTSSWSFPGWDGLVYAGAHPSSRLSRHGLGAYAAHPWYRTVGVDSGYHAPLPRARLAGYAEQVPPDFRFLVKAPALITDPFERGGGGVPRATNPGFLDPTRATELAVAPFVEGLGSRAGVLLFQFPPLGRALAEQPRRFAEALYRFLHRLPQGPCYAVEVRDRGLLTRDLAEALRHGGARPAHALHPRLPDLAAQQQCFADLPPGPVVIRWMLHAGFGYEAARRRYAPFDRLHDPDPASRAAIARLVRAALGAGESVYVIVNNKAEGCAPLSLEALGAEILGGEG